MDNKFIPLIVKCPYCQNSLMDHNKLIKGEASIKLYFKSGDYSGTLNLCALYGCNERESDFKLHQGDIIDIFCPECEKNLKTKSICNICGAPVVDLRLVTGGIMRICSRVDCKKHSVLFEDIYEDMTRYFIKHKYRTGCI